MRKLLPILLLLICATSCTDFWSGANQRRFKEVCATEAIKWAGTDAAADEYCNCVLQKMMERYPNEEDAFQHLGDLSHDTALIRCREGR